MSFPRELNLQVKPRLFTRARMPTGTRSSASVRWSAASPLNGDWISFSVQRTGEFISLSV